MVDDGLSYSASGFRDLRHRPNYLFNEYFVQLEPLPSTSKSDHMDQYGCGDYCSPAHCICSSFVVFASADDTTMLNVQYLVGEACSTWVMGLDVTSYNDIIRRSNRYLFIPGCKDNTQRFPLRTRLPPIPASSAFCLWAHPSQWNVCPRSVQKYTVFLTTPKRSC